MHTRPENSNLRWRYLSGNYPWLKRLLSGTFLFFLVKGLIWLALLAWVFLTT